MKRRLMIVWILACLTLGCCGTFHARADGMPIRVSVCAPAPLRDVLCVLSTCHDTRIHYQDPAYFDLPGKSFGREEGLGFPLATSIPFRFTFSTSNDLRGELRSLLDHYKQVDPQVEWQVEINTNFCEYYVWPVSWSSRAGGLVTNQDVMKIERVLKWPTNLTATTVVRAALKAVAIDSPYESKSTYFTGGISVNEIPLRYGKVLPGVITGLLTSAVSCKTILDSLCRYAPGDRKLSWHLCRVPAGINPSYVVFTDASHDLRPNHDQYIVTCCPDELAFQIDEIEAVFKFPVGFEEPELVEGGDFLGESSVWGYSFSVFSFNSQESCAAVLAELAADIERTEYTFTTFRADAVSSNVFQFIPSSRVLPDSARKPGVPERVDGVSISDKCISLKLREASIEDAMMAICAESAKACSRKIEFMPTRALRLSDGRKVDFACDKMAMNRCLSTVLPKFSSKVSWRLRYLPKTRSYRLVVHEIGELAAGPWGNGPQDR